MEGPGRGVEAKNRVSRNFRAAGKIRWSVALTDYCYTSGAPDEVSYNRQEFHPPKAKSQPLRGLDPSDVAGMSPEELKAEASPWLCLRLRVARFWHF